MSKIYETKDTTEKIFLVKVVLNNKINVEIELAELKALAEAAGGEVVGSLTQKLDKPDVRFFIGTGKLEELKQQVKQTNATMVVFDNELTGSKINNLESELDVKVIDRTMLILDIFANRALSNEGKLQVELAQMKYNLPRLNAISGTSGRYGSGGIGMRGPGETKLEINRRIVEQKIQEKEKQLKKLKQERDLRRQKRMDSKKPLVAIVGYTNSGKSTLLNTITKANILAKDMLFATLDTTTRSLWLGLNKEVMLVDTVGFVSHLPHELVEAFSSTLEETVYADVLLNVVDISNPYHDEQEKIVLEVLNSLGVNDTPIITVYNKTDKVEQIDKKPNCVYISAKNNLGIDELKQKLVEILFDNV